MLNVQRGQLVKWGPTLHLVKKAPEPPAPQVEAAEPPAPPADGGDPAEKPAEPGTSPHAPPPPPATVELCCGDKAPEHELYVLIKPPPRGTDRCRKCDQYWARYGAPKAS